MSGGMCTAVLSGTGKIVAVSYEIWQSEGLREGVWTDHGTPTGTVDLSVRYRADHTGSAARRENGNADIIRRKGLRKGFGCIAYSGGYAYFVPGAADNTAEKTE